MVRYGSELIAGSGEVEIGCKAITAGSGEVVDECGRGGCGSEVVAGCESGEAAAGEIVAKSGSGEEVAESREAIVGCVCGGAVVGFGKVIVGVCGETSLGI